jgi:hypothetical protein
MTSKSTAARPLTVRSAISNNLLRLRNVDGRSAEARRYRDLVHAYANDVGGVETLTEAQRALVTQAASVQTSAERLQSRIVKGEAVDGEELTRLSNVLARLLAAIGMRKGNGKPSDGASALHSYLQSLAERDVDAVEDAEEGGESPEEAPMEIEKTKTGALSSADATEHVAAAEGFAPSVEIGADDVEGAEP